MDFGELQNDEAFKQRINTLTAALDEIGRSAQAACQMPNYEKLSTEEKVKFDLFLSYSINSLFWAFCKLQAIDPADVSATHRHQFKLTRGFFLEWH